MMQDPLYYSDWVEGTKKYQLGFRGGTPEGALFFAHLHPKKRLK